MLSHKEHEAMILFDRLLMMADENETIADLLDQTLNVARMIDPAAENRDVVYGPLQRMHFEWQQTKQRLDQIEQRLNTLNSNLNNPGRQYHTYLSPTTYPLSGTTGDTKWGTTAHTGFVDEDYSMASEMKNNAVHDLITQQYDISALKQNLVELNLGKYK